MAAGSRSAAEERHDEGAVELSLRLRTGSSSGSSAAAEDEAAAAAARSRSMTIFYKGRVCAVDVTELQARAIITMANHQMLTEQQRRDSDRHLQDSSSSSNNNAEAHCGGHRSAKLPAPQCPAPSLASSPIPRRLTGAAEGTVAAPVVSQAAAAGLSMKRSLQQFLQKRKTRVAALGSPYAGGRATRHSATPGAWRVEDTY